MPLGKIYYQLCQRLWGHQAAWATIRVLRRIGLSRGFRMPLDALSLDHDSLAGLMRLWSRIHWSSGDGMMPSEQLLEIYQLAASWSVKGDIVELGSWVGLTTSYLATACAVRGSGVVHAVDTFEGTKEDGQRYPSIERFDGSTLDAFRTMIKQAGVAQRVREHIGYTTEVAHRYSGRPIRVLLIDADHSYDGVRSDFLSWFPHVADGGLIIFHDYLMADVARFVDALVENDPTIKSDPGHVVSNVMAVTKVVESSSPERAAKTIINAPMVC